MQKLLERIAKAPLTYIVELRKLEDGKYLHLKTSYSPAYPIMILTSLISVLAFSAFVIYYFFTSSLQSQCLQGSSAGVYIISILYPIETLLCFICITGTIALSNSHLWKIFWILVFGPIITGFGFGQLGLVYLCLISGDSNHSKIPGIVTRPGFIAAIVYIYIGFFFLYWILVPIFSHLYGQQQKDKKAKKQQQENLPSESPKRQSVSKKGNKEVQAAADEKTQETSNKQAANKSSNKYFCFTYYFLHTLLFFDVVFILLIKVLGPIILTYVWVDLSANMPQNPTPKSNAFLALCIICYFAPITAFLGAFIIKKIFKKSGGDVEQKSEPEVDGGEASKQEGSKRQRFSRKSISATERQQLQLSKQKGTEGQVNQKENEKNNDKSVRKALL